MLKHIVHWHCAQGENQENILCFTKFPLKVNLFSLYRRNLIWVFSLFFADITSSSWARTASAPRPNWPWTTFRWVRNVSASEYRPRRSPAGGPTWRMRNCVTTTVCWETLFDNKIAFCHIPCKESSNKPANKPVLTKLNQAKNQPTNTLKLKGILFHSAADLLTGYE